MRRRQWRSREQCAGAGRVSSLAVHCCGDLGRTGREAGSAPRSHCPGLETEKSMAVVWRAA